MERMLRELRIRDFAIIDDLTVRFQPGLNVLTGETGAGKSIIVDALGLALGERAQSGLVRAGRAEAAVTALFETDAPPLLDRLGISPDDGIILRRLVAATGKSRAYISDTPVNIQTLLELGRSLVDIHGQHEHQSILSTEQQRTLLDASGGIAAERAAFGELFRFVQGLQAELESLSRDTREKEQRIDLLRFQINEIDAAALREGEREALEEERAILSNLARLTELTDSAYSLLYGADGSAVEKVSAAAARLREVARIDQGISEVLGLLESAQPLLDDAASTLRSYRERYDADPRRLEAVEERLDLIRRLERKYGEDIAAVMSFREKAGQELASLAGSDERIGEIRSRLAVLEKELAEKAANLSARRRAAAIGIETAVKAVLKELAMGKAGFSVGLRPAPLTASGQDSVEFLFSANEGEPLKPLARIASGGELSRVMLAIKETLADADRIPVLIFDEVDAGIGGRTAEHVGRRLRSLGRRHQVIAITHLPQIAAMADHHIVIEKTRRKDGVYVTVTEPTAGEREAEIARMLSGKITDISLEHARELLGKRQ